ncbi:MAG: FAD-dependent oxidoreductase [Thermomicrobiales bacterium]
MPDRVVVIGGGVVGLSSAWALRKRGWTVTVVTNRDFGYGASRVNAGWISPGWATPVPAPGLVRTSMKWMRSSSSPLYIQPRPSPSFMRWTLDFWRHCNEKDYWHGVEALAGLGKRAFETFDTMRADGISFEEHHDGILFVFRTPAGLEDELEMLARFGPINGLQIQGPIVGDDLRQMEPALTEKIHGGIWMTQERSIRPDTLNSALVSWLEANDVDLRSGVSVEDLTIEGNRVTNVVLDHGRIETDAVLIAAGVWSPQIARFAKRRIPIEGGKGYSLDYTPAPVEIRHPIEVFDGRHVITPMNGMTRLAGTMEFSGNNATIRPERVEAIVRGTADIIRGWPTDLSIPVVSSGLRPMSSDGLPLIGYLKDYRNLAIATGHGMMGLTLAPATGDAIADLMTNNGSRELLKPFDPARF